MSGIAAIYNLDGRPVESALLARMTDAMSHRGPDGVGHWVDGEVGLGHRMLHTTPESLEEKQPLLNESSNVCLTLDGRVDNREELKSALEGKGARLRTDTDAELVLRAYECWGEECPARIIGDFAFVIWDGRNRLLFCARDPLGLKPLYYYLDGDTFLCGSEHKQLFEHPAVPRKPNLGMVGEYLACNLINNEETLYEGVFRLPPAHLLIVRASRISKRRYWDIDPRKEIRYRTDTEYAEQFLETFKEAVRCRLRSYGAVGAELSGGVDSSSIVGMIQSLYRGGELPCTGFETFSLVFPGLQCDESKYIQEVEQMWGIKSNRISPDASYTFYYGEEVRRYEDFPQHPNGIMSYPLMSLAQDKGIRVLLSGGGGDEWFTGSFYHYADFLREFRILALIRQIRCDRQFNYDSGIPAIIFPPLSILRTGFWPLMPKAVRRGLKLLIRGKDKAPPWIKTDFAQNVELTGRLRKQSTGLRFTSFAQEDIYSTLTGGWLSHGSELATRVESWFKVERRQPFLDRRIIEFALALPEDQRWRTNQPKFIIRQAMQGLLPESIRSRLTKADFSHVFAKAFEALGGKQFFNSLTIASMGWVDGEIVRGMYEEMARLYAQDNAKYISYIWKLAMVVGIELWFNTVFLKKDVLIREQAYLHRMNSLLV